MNKRDEMLKIKEKYIKLDNLEEALEEACYDILALKKGIQVVSTNKGPGKLPLKSRFHIFLADYKAKLNK